MPLYSYKGFENKSGKTIKGRVEADSVKSAKAKLKKDGIIGAEVKEEKSSQKNSGQSSDGFISSLFAPRIALSDIAIMTRQFATLQTAHIPIDECLRALSRQVENPALQGVLSSLKDQVSEGRSIGDAAAQHPNVFSKLYVNMLKAGESSGALDLVLRRLADYLEYRIQTRGQIMSAMTYPAIMITASGGIVVYLFVSVVPKLTKIFDNLNVRLPWYTKMLINISDFMQRYWYLCILAVFAVVYFFNKWKNSPAGRAKFDELSLKAPLFGSLILRMNVSSFTKTLSTLLSSGVPIIRAMEITKNIIDNTVIAGIVEKAKTAVQEGESLGAVIERSGRFPPLVSHMIMTGEKTGQLEEMLGHVSVAYDAEVDRKISALIATIEPIMIILMGGISALIIVAMLLPMFQVMNQVR